MAESESHSYRRAGAIVLGLVMLAAILVVQLVHDVSESAITQAHHRYSLDRIEALVPAPHNNDVAADVIQWQTERFFSRPQSFRIYRARQNGRPTGVVLMPIEFAGYNGPIRMAIGINRNGRISGITILSHQETPGLGAAIDPSRSDWLQQFRGKSLKQPESTQWKLARQSGQFDAISGATITSAAVLNATHATLQFYTTNQEAIYRQAH